MTRSYFPLSSRGGWPAGGSVFYECSRCGDLIPSMPKECASCRCGNVDIDVDYGRLSIEEQETARVFTDEHLAETDSRVKR